MVDMSARIRQDHLRSKLVGNLEALKVELKLSNTLDVCFKTSTVASSIIGSVSIIGEKVLFHFKYL